MVRLYMPGDAGGGIATALGTRGRGVFIARIFVGVPVLGTRPPSVGFGVVNGDPLGRVGEDSVRVGEDSVLRAGLDAVTSRVLSCFAVIVTYFEAREPAVILPFRDVFFVLAPLAALRGGRTPGVMPGVTRPEESEPGVTLPPFADGVVHVLRLKDVEGVILPEVRGVVRPPREDATDEGRSNRPVVGNDSFVVATNTPQFGGQAKYRFPPTDPSFLPFPANPPLSSTPAHSPALPSISPMY